MSAVRNSSTRAESRKKRSNPYARSVVRSVYRFLGWKFEDDAQEAAETSSDSLPSISSASRQPIIPSKNLQDLNGHETTRHRQYTNNERPPLSPVKLANFGSRDPVPSDGPNHRPPVEAMDTGARPQNSDAFTFRFTTPGHSLPLASSGMRMATPSSSSRKKLSQNPNGTYRWEGAGSAKHARPRNRYHSPAFGVSPVKSERLVLKESDSEPLSDIKRRKVDEAGVTNSRPSGSDPAHVSAPLPFPISSSPTRTTNGNTARPNQLSSSSRLRTPAKPTAPVVPSPLRQAWSDASSSTSSRGETRKSPAQSSKPTNTANIFAGLIKETTPPVKPDLSNPYQSASPVGKVGPPRRGTKRLRATGKPSAPIKDGTADNQKLKQKEEMDKILDISPQAIIEATVPKGSKRSRPPAQLVKQTSPSEEKSFPQQREAPIAAETSKIPYVVEEPDDDEESRRSPKKAKPTVNGYGRPPPLGTKTSTSLPDITMTEVGDNVVQSSETDKPKESQKLTTQTNGSNGHAAALNASTSRASFTTLKPSSIPKEPSKLRFSFQAEGSSIIPTSPTSGPAPLPQPIPQPPLPKSEFKFSTPSHEFGFTFKVDDKATSPKSQSQPLKREVTEVEPMPTIEAIKTTVCGMSILSLPTFTFVSNGTSTLSTSTDHIKAQNDAKSLAKDSLPTFDFESAKSAAPFSFNYDPSKSKPNPSYVFRPSPPKPIKLGTSIPSTTGPSALTSDAGGPKVIPAPIKGFDFEAAGMKPPSVSKDTKACSLCGIFNPFTATQCQTCEEPFPGAPSTPAPSTPPVLPPAPPVKGFDFAAAGMKVPTMAKGTWTCSLCASSSPDTSNECVVCETPK